jgi:hypothetical protein
MNNKDKESGEKSVITLFDKVLLLEPPANTSFLSLWLVNGNHQYNQIYHYLSLIPLDNLSVDLPLLMPWSCQSKEKTPPAPQ